MLKDEADYFRKPYKLPSSKSLGVLNTFSRTLDGSAVEICERSLNQKRLEARPASFSFAQRFGARCFVGVTVITRKVAVRFPNRLSPQAHSKRGDPLSLT
jgi:hypothetical protein